MAQLVDIQRVEVGPQKLIATVRIADSGPLMTNEDLEGTTRVYNLMPHIIEHVCLGDAGETFRDVMGNTELAHLLEHMTVELLAQSGIAGDVSAGRTYAVGNNGRTFAIELACPDDVLVAGAFSSACWMMAWAFGGGGDPEPDVEATITGLVALVESLPISATTPSPSPSISQTASLEDDSREVTQEVSLRLVPDEEMAHNSVKSEESDLHSTQQQVSTHQASSPSVERPLRESPEARQAATDEFADEVESNEGLASRVQHDAGVTGSMPDAKSIR